MSHLDDFNAIKDLITAVKKVKRPSIPMSSYIQEAYNLYGWCKADKAILMKEAGLDPLFIDELPVRAGASNHTQLLWTKQRKTKSPAEKKWDIQSLAAYKLKDKLLSDFRYAFRDNARLLKGVRAMAKSRGYAGMVQALNDLSVFGKANTLELEKIKFDMTDLDLAATISSNIGRLRPASRGKNRPGGKAKLLRDQAYTYLKQAVDEVRACGKYTFEKDKARLIGYRSEYIRKHY